MSITQIQPFPSRDFLHVLLNELNPCVIGPVVQTVGHPGQLFGLQVFVVT